MGGVGRPTILRWPEEARRGAGVAARVPREPSGARVPNLLLAARASREAVQAKARHRWALAKPDPLVPRAHWAACPTQEPPKDHLAGKLAGQQVLQGHKAPASALRSDRSTEATKVQAA